ncbi:Tex family protein [Dehalobacter sp.]|uniref:Tex family protein n=1 Tax=Dehalobacter sp. TaxID=1962289 RepID=UPI00258C9013|nr:Tex family protein [Dehalobacter sp.]MCG1026339.1 RNA-binding transcriptional accessory protein [Dehalobacter sp.]
MDFISVISRELGLRTWQVGETVKLLDQGNTIPFIARYRKEATGELDETVLRTMADRLEYIRNLELRKEEVIRLINEQGKLDDGLRSKIEAAAKLQEVEDLYRPYKQKKRTRASIAREKGLEPLADWLFNQPAKGSLQEEAAKYLNPDLNVHDAAEALSGARDIIAENVSDDAETRKLVRTRIYEWAEITAKAKKEERSPYEMYYEYKEPVRKIPPHRVLALNRGEKEEFLSVGLEIEADKILQLLEKKYLQGGPCQELMKEALQDSYKRLIYPSIEREIRAEITSRAGEQAVKVFSANLRQLLLQPPVRDKVIMGLDPGYRTGCKWALIDDTGKLGEVGVIYPNPPQNKKKEAKQLIAKVVEQYGVQIIAIGNGTASRETEELVTEFIRESGRPLEYIIVSEAGASVYSASPLAKEEFPDFDLSLRSAVSIARRLQDPLAELVKIEPKAIGVGQYQHDIQPKVLESSLGGVVESCVNTVGVNLNTASPSILKFVSGLNYTVAKNIVSYREKNGKFRCREELKKVSRLGEQTYIQCAGFIRLPDGDNCLENTPVHPESYDVASAILKKANLTAMDLKTNPEQVRAALGGFSAEGLAAELQAGVPTVKDILEALLRPGRDPREDLPRPLLRQDITKLEDLQVGISLEGTVRNIVDFGAFVDIGVKNDGLVHISELSNSYVRHPMEVISVGDIVKVRVLGIDHARGRVSLSMKDI